VDNGKKLNLPISIDNEKDLDYFYTKFIKGYMLGRFTGNIQINFDKGQIKVVQENIWHRG